MTKWLRRLDFTTCILNFPTICFDFIFEILTINNVININFLFVCIIVVSKH